MVEAPELPEAPERRADPEPDVRFACFQRPRERGADVVALRVETLEPLALVRPEQSRLGRLREHEAVLGVPTTDGFAVAASRETLERVLADRLEHPQARLVAAASPGRQQVVPEQRLDALDDVDVAPAGDGLGSVGGEPSDEDAEAREELLLCGVEELVAPGDRTA